MTDPDLPDRPPQEEAESDDDAITAEIPAVRAARGALDGTLVWLVVGAVVGVVALAIFAGGLSRSSDSGAGPAPTTATRARTATVPGPAVPTATTATGRTATAAAPEAATRRDVLRVAVAAAQGLYFEVRRGAADGDVVFAGTLEQGAAKRFAIPRNQPLWLSLAWAPSARIAINGTAVPVSGGTETYLVTADGLERLGADGSPTTSR